MTRFVVLSVAVFLFALTAKPLTSDLPEEVKAEHNLARRFELAVDLADEAIDQARSAYKGGDQKRGEAKLELVSALADDCLDSAQQMHKSKYWKRAELKMAALRRRVNSLADELGYDQRDRARDLSEHLDSIHDKLLIGVMGK